MLEKLQAIEKLYHELNEKMADPKLAQDRQQFQKVGKKRSELEVIVEAYHRYRDVLGEIESTKDLLTETTDSEMQDLAEGELNELEASLAKIEEEIKMLLLPKDPNDDKNVIVEIRGGTGGDEAALFAGNLYRMYSHYAENRRWKQEILSGNPTELGGFKEIIFMIEGRGAYSRLKYESGVHRVQRVPETESGGRIHTSTATVAVLPEAEEVDVYIDPSEIKIDVFRSSGPGGQSVNTTDSAVRITHLPTGIVVSCQDEKSQHKNRDKALRILRARLMELAEAEARSKEAKARKSQIGTGDRSERIRTYNYPQGRVTDHRINLTLYRIEEILNGDLDEIIEALSLVDQQERLKEME
ncbi:MAG: peptide chain release factor 1 [Firmicutes bacterium]|nr:peptide chain release factor 1 [Bacillota bacterium]MDD4264679.1 peptide chain release factor 1 [Bacillota bacterium]MDD4693586.1 peptide chain release factor 1 [Bacillota bacterium]